MSGFVKLLAVDIDHRLAHPLQVLVTLLQQAGGGVRGVLLGKRERNGKR